MRGLTGLLALIGAACVAPAFAQEVSGGAEGWVTDDEGRPLAEVEVVGTAPDRSSRWTVFTRADGHFRLAPLPVGTYGIQLRQVGYRPVLFPEVRVRLGETASLGRVRLEPEAVGMPELVVSGEEAGLDVGTAATRVTLDVESLELLPVDRGFRSVVPLAPQANPSFLGDELNIAGSTGLENAYFVDGVNVTDPYLGANSIDLPYNFIEDIQLVTGGYEAELGRAQGGIVNVITRSGTNRLAAEAYAFLRSSALTTAPRFGVGEIALSDFAERDMGLNLSGPVVRDRAWFFMAYNPTFERRRPIVPGLGALADDRTRHRFAGKLDWRAGTATEMSLTIAGDPNAYDRVAPFVLTAAPSAFADAAVVLGHVTEGGVSVAVRARHQAGARVAFEGMASYLGMRNDILPRMEGTALQPVVQDVATGIVSGGYGGFQRDRNRRIAAQGRATVSLRGHLLGAGIEVEDNFTDHRFELSREGGAAGILTHEIDGTYTLFEFSSRARSHNRVVTLYLQDAWQIASRWLINAGWRFEPQRFATDGAESRTLVNQLLPRLGVVYQPGPPGTQKLFASAGRYQEQIPVVLSATVDGRTAVAFTSYPDNPFERSARPAALLGSGVADATPPAPRPQYYDEVTLGYERLLGHGVRGSIRAMYRAIREVIEDASDTSGVFVVGNPGRGALAHLPKPTRDYTALELMVQRSAHPRFNFLASYVLSRDYGNYTGLFASDAGIGGGNIGPQFDFPSQLTNGTGLLPADRTHVFKLSGSYRTGPSLTAGLTFLVASGTPLSEYGAIPEAGRPYWSFITQRGTAGRTPAIWDLGVRIAWDVRGGAPGHPRPRVLLDLLHIGSPRRAVEIDQLHYTALDGTLPTAPNPTYGQVIQYQGPMSLRLGVELGL